MARDAAGLTQADAAAQAGLTPAAISHFEKGRREPSAGNLRKLVRALGTSADYLLATRPGTDDVYRERAQ